jgi:hypothetical protein
MARPESDPKQTKLFIENSSVFKRYFRKFHLENHHGELKAQNLLSKQLLKAGTRFFSTKRKYF